MTASKLYTVHCDAPHCGYWDEAGVGDTAADARRNLSGGGWRLSVKDPDGWRGRLDFCPRHAAYDLQRLVKPEKTP
jgi:hypothetical protein